MKRLLTESLLEKIRDLPYEDRQEVLQAMEELPLAFKDIGGYKMGKMYTANFRIGYCQKNESAIFLTIKRWRIVYEDVD